MQVLQEFLTSIITQWSLDSSPHYNFSDHCWGWNKFEPTLLPQPKLCWLPRSCYFCMVPHNNIRSYFEHPRKEWAFKHLRTGLEGNREFQHKTLPWLIQRGSCMKKVVSRKYGSLKMICWRFPRDQDLQSCIQWTRSRRTWKRWMPVKARSAQLLSQKLSIWHAQ